MIIDIITKTKTKIKLSPDELFEIIKYCNIKNIQDIKLDEEFKMSYCLKMLACAVWCVFNNHKGFETILKEVYQEGGDTDTTGCIVGAIIGCIKGKSLIPKEWITNLKHTDFINKKINQYYESKLL
jgi:ADP-ribosylglycohydrolase